MVGCTEHVQEEAAKLRAKLGDKAITPDSGELMMPLTPILRQRNWPLLEVNTGGFGGAAAAEALTAATAGGGGGGIAAAAAAAAAAGDNDEDIDVDAWGGDDLGLGGDGDGATPRGAADDDDEDGGWEMEVRCASTAVLLGWWRRLCSIRFKGAGGPHSVAVSCQKSFFLNPPSLETLPGSDLPCFVADAAFCMTVLCQPWTYAVAE